MGQTTPVGGVSIDCVVTPTISTSIYAASDQVGGLQTLINASTGIRFITTLLSIVVVDKDKQNAALTIFFYNDIPTIASSDNAALNVSDSENASKCIGHIVIADTDYQSMSSTSIASVKMSSCATSMASKVAGGHLYAVMMTTGTPTYTSTSGLVIKYVFGQDVGGQQTA